MPGHHDALEGLAAADFDQMRTQLRVMQEKLNRITDITSGIIYILDVDGRFVFINNAVEEILHYATSEIIGRHFSEIMPPGEYNKVARDVVLPQFHGKNTGPEKAPKLFDERRTGARSTRNLEVQLLTRERRDVKILMGNVTGIIGVEGSYDPALFGVGRNKGEAFLGSQGIIYDITRYKIIEREKLLLQQRLHDAQKMEVVGRLTGGLAHSFNNKLVTILGFTELLQLANGPSGDPVMKELIDKMLTTSRQTEDLTRRLLSFARVEESQAPETMDIHDVVRPVAELLSAFAGRNIHVSQELKAASPMIMGERSSLQNAILHVAINSAEAMPFGGDLGFATESATIAGCEWVKLIVVNVPDDSDEARELQKVNSGLQHALFERDISFGLAHAQECVASHGGTMTVSRHGGSSVRVEILLPRAVSVGK